jgi:hypothetical protein
MRGTMCPRCERVVRITKNGKLYSHQRLNAYGHCPYSGVTPEDAKNKISSLARRLIDTGHVKNTDSGKWEKVT